jgi:hypothetical protein
MDVLIIDREFGTISDSQVQASLQKTPYKGSKVRFNAANISIDRGNTSDNDSIDNTINPILHIESPFMVITAELSSYTECIKEFCKQLRQQRLKPETLFSEAIMFHIKNDWNSFTGELNDKAKMQDYVNNRFTVPFMKLSSIDRMHLAMMCIGVLSMDKSVDYQFFIFDDTTPIVNMVSNILFILYALTSAVSYKSNYYFYHLTNFEVPINSTKIWNNDSIINIVLI